MELGYGFPVLVPIPRTITFSGTNSSFIVSAIPTSTVNVSVGDIVYLYYSINCLRNGVDGYVRGNVEVSGTAVLETTGLSNSGLPFTLNVLALSAGSVIGEAYATARRIASAGSITSVGCASVTTSGTSPINIFSHLRVVITHLSL